MLWCFRPCVGNTFRIRRTAVFARIILGIGQYSEFFCRFADSLGRVRFFVILVSQLVNWETEHRPFSAIFRGVRFPFPVRFFIMGKTGLQIARHGRKARLSPFAWVGHTETKLSPIPGWNWRVVEDCIEAKALSLPKKDKMLSSDKQMILAVASWMLPFE